MAWYKEGTVGVTNGSTAVTLAGGNALANIFPGDTFLGPDGRPYEVAQVTSAGGFVLATAYAGPTASGQPYVIQPTAQSGAIRLMLDQVSNLVTNYQSGRDAWSSAASGTLKGRKSAGAGLVEDLSPAAARALLDLANHEQVTVTSDGRVGIGTSTFDGAGDRRLQVGGTNTASQALVKSSTTHLSLYASSGTDAYISVPTGGAMRVGHGPADGSSFTDRIVVDASGNFLVGMASGAAHAIAKPVARGERILSVWSPIVNNAVEFYAGDIWGPNAAATVLKLGSNSVTGRSINAGGTVNAGGADYAEYMTKAQGCGTIQPGHICGVNIDGLLTDRWDAAHTFVIKSTDPAYVGNDTWAQALGPRPEQPALALPVYTGPDLPADDDPDYAEKLEAWRTAQEIHATAVAAAEADHAAAMQVYQQELADFETRLEAERQKVDRIAFSGQVPVNVQGALPGQYIDAAPGPDGSIIGVPVDAPGPRTVGKVWKTLEDGRAWVAVMIS